MRSESDVTVPLFDGLRLGLRVRRCVGVLAAWRRRSRQRRELAEMDMRELHDIGLTPYDVGAECAKPFWKA